MGTADSGRTPEIPDHDHAPTSNEPWNVWTVPNLVSLLRLCGIPLFLWLVLVEEADLAAFVVLVLAGASDWVDGYLARRLDQRSRLGVLLDPAVDRLYILATLVDHCCEVRAGLRYRSPTWARPQRSLCSGVSPCYSSAPYPARGVPPCRSSGGPSPCGAPSCIGGRESAMPAT